MNVSNFFSSSSDNRDYSAAAAPAVKRNEGKIVAVIGAVVDVQVLFIHSFTFHSFIVLHSYL